MSKSPHGRLIASQREIELPYPLPLLSQIQNFSPITNNIRAPPPIPIERTNAENILLIRSEGSIKGLSIPNSKGAFDREFSVEFWFSLKDVPYKDYGRYAIFGMEDTPYYTGLSLFAKVADNQKFTFWPVYFPFTNEEDFMAMAMTQYRDVSLNTLYLEIPEHLVNVHSKWMHITLSITITTAKKEVLLVADHLFAVNSNLQDMLIGDDLTGIYYIYIYI